MSDQKLVNQSINSLLQSQQVFFLFIAQPQIYQDCESELRQILGPQQQVYYDERLLKLFFQPQHSFVKTLPEGAQPFSG